MTDQGKINNLGKNINILNAQTGTKSKGGSSAKMCYTGAPKCGSSTNMTDSKLYSPSWTVNGGACPCKKPTSVLKQKGGTCTNCGTRHKGGNKSKKRTTKKGGASCDSRRKSAPTKKGGASCGSRRKGTTTKKGGASCGSRRKSAPTKKGGASCGSRRKSAPTKKGGASCGSRRKSAPTKKGGASDWMSSQYSRGPSNTPNMSVKQFRQFNKDAEYIPNRGLAMAAAPLSSGYMKQTNPGPSGYNIGTYETVGSCLKGGTKKRRTKKTNKKGGASDWMSTVYSRGPSNTPNMSEKQFRQFNKDAEYIPNRGLAMAATPLLSGYMKQTNPGPSGYNIGTYESAGTCVKGGKGKRKTKKGGAFAAANMITQGENLSPCYTKPDGAKIPRAGWHAGGATKNKKKNPWLEHVKAFRKKNPGMQYKDVLKNAKKTYKK